MVHEGDIYFERCYSADFAEQLANTQREACWQAWLADYTRFQPAHRIDYAMRRIEALQNGEPLPKLPGLSSGPQDLALMSALDGGVGEGRLSPVMEGDGAVVPNGCGHFCDAERAHCDARCPPQDRACVQTCERERAFCLHGCH